MRVIFKGTVLLECKTRQVCIYLYISAPMNGDTVWTPKHSTHESETAHISEPRGVSLSLVCY